MKYYNKRQQRAQWRTGRKVLVFFSIFKRGSPNETFQNIFPASLWVVMGGLYLRHDWLRNDKHRVVSVHNRRPKEESLHMSSFCACVNSLSVVHALLFLKAIHLHVWKGYLLFIFMSFGFRYSTTLIKCICGACVVQKQLFFKQVKARLRTKLLNYITDISEALWSFTWALSCDVHSCTLFIWPAEGDGVQRFNAWQTEV